MNRIAATDNPHDVVVIGGGPAGAAIARMLARRGHSVAVLARRAETRRGLAESLPPSTRKVLAAVGALDAIEAAGICRNTGNEVWWGSDDARTETFGGAEQAQGFQVWRPDFDRLLADQAVAAGVTWLEGNVRGADVDSGALASTTFVGADGVPVRLRSRHVVDASGREGVLARRVRRVVGERRTHAWIGMWQCGPGEWSAHATRTLVETFADGWAWSVPVSDTRRCVTVMIDPDLTPTVGPGQFAVRYRAQLEKTTHVRRVVERAALEHAWGCDASLYDTAEVGGARHLLVGDAVSFIDPLSSFGVKKALTSAWMGAAVVHTTLTTPALADAAVRLFGEREREVHASSVLRSVDYARDAAARHATPFWTERSRVPSGIDANTFDDMPDRPGDLSEVLAGLRRSSGIDLRPGRSLRFEWQPAIRGHRVELERAVASAGMRRAVRFVDNVDVTRLVEMAAHYRQVGELFEGYCRTARPVPLPNFLKALAVLVARQMLEPADGQP